jgi:hypothetical protein
MPSKRISNPELDDHASAIGCLCFLYNGLETRTTNLVGLLATLEDEDVEIFGNQIDLLKKLPILKALAFKYRLSKQWYDDIELMVWAIEKRLR